MKAVRYAGAAVCLALAAYFMAPLVMGILHIGMVYPAALLALAAVHSVIDQRNERESCVERTFYFV